MKRFFLFSLAALAMCCGQLNADTILVNEDFSYADGALVPNGGWELHSGGAGTLLVSSGQAVVEHGVPDEDANVLFGSTISTGILEAALDIVVNDDTAMGGTDFEYFAHFMTRGSFDFTSRVDIQAGTAGGDYTLGIATDSGSSEAVLAQDFTYGDTVSLVLTYDFDTDLSSLTVGTETISSTTLNDRASLDAFGLRQSDSSNNETVLVDNLVITHVMAVPEPSSLALLGLASLGLVVRRRR